MAKQYIAKESTAQEILKVVKNISGSGVGETTIGTSAMSDVIAANVTLISESSAALTWEDPIDNILDGIKISDWLGTKVVRKEGSVPVDETDGVVVIDTSVRNQYRNSLFIDTGLTCELGTNHHYYYRWFPYNVYGVHTPGMAKDIVTSKGISTTIYVTKTALGLYPTHMEESLILYNYTDGEITVKTSNPNIAATLTDSGVCKILTVTANYIVEGEYTVTLTQQGTDVFNGYGELIIPVTLTEDTNKIISPMNVVSTDIAPELWQQMLNDGVVTTFFNVGDSVPIELNGNLIEADGTTIRKSFDHETYYLTILGFDHNKELESNGKNSIHFIFGKNTAGVDIAFHGFRMNTSNTNTGGWKLSGMRTNTCASFLEGLPPRWQSLIGTITKYTDNTGGANGTLTNVSQVTATQDKVFLLAEYEVQGKRSYGNTGEASKQVQYDYYKNGNSKIRYNADSTTSVVYWWFRSPAGATDYFGNKSGDYCFCLAQGGNAWFGPAHREYTFAPAFSLIAES